MFFAFPCALVFLSLVVQPVVIEGTDPKLSEFSQGLFAQNAKDYSNLVNVSETYLAKTDLVWTDNPKQWHQQLARIVDHRFTTFSELKSFALRAKQAGISALMLVQIQNSVSCPGSWYNGLQLCDHINGSYPVDDGSLEEWQQMVSELKPMKLMWWANMDYWSVQGEVWAQAKQDQFSDVGRFFSWNATKDDVCWGNNPDGAQGSWGSDGSFKGVEAALASWGSQEYVDYLSDAMANTWTRNLAIDGYTIDCVGCYGKSSNCPNGMLQTTDAELSWASIIAKVRSMQPQVVYSGESYGSWAEVIKTNSDIGGQGFPEYHTVMQNAVLAGDVSAVENTASTSGADAATVLCYLNPFYDGKQPGACPTMYFRDSTAVLQDLSQHQLWVALEAGSGIVPQHDFDPEANNGAGAWWNVTNDPADPSQQSPLWAFTKYRALNRLALRTKLNITATRTSRGMIVEDTPTGYIEYVHENCWSGHGGVEIDTNPVSGLSPTQCVARCTADSRCNCVTYFTGAAIANNSDGSSSRRDSLNVARTGVKNSASLDTYGYSKGDCWKRGQCAPAAFEKDAAAAPFTVYVQKPTPSKSGGALVYLKHDSMGETGAACLMVFNPGEAQNVTVDLSFLPQHLFDRRVIPFDLLANNNNTQFQPLSKSWTVEMGAKDVKALGGFSLGVFAPRLGKKGSCLPDSADGFSKNVTSTLQGCFIECLNEPRCENVFVQYVEIVYMEAPPLMQCTLLGNVSNPDESCNRGTGTLIHKLTATRPRPLQPQPHQQ
eukprot:m.111402 g.111402  ORF g.111402 m.111402 type:complete len:772 (+) comp28119_c0_seq1:329-2644(+)